MGAVADRGRGLFGSTFGSNDWIGVDTSGNTIDKEEAMLATSFYW